jgi:hypothetical protein
MLCYIMLRYVRLVEYIYIIVYCSLWSMIKVLYMLAHSMFIFFRFSYSMACSVIHTAQRGAEGPVHMLYISRCGFVKCSC